MESARTVEAWWALDGKVHREVAEHAAEGRLHPDARIADLSLAWASTVDTTRPPPVRRVVRGAWDAARVVVDLGLTLLGEHGTFGVCDVSSERGRRRLARQLSELRPPE